MTVTSNTNHLSSYLNHTHTHTQGLKTGMYYLRTKAAANAIQFTVDQTVIQKTKGKSDGSSSPAKENEDKEYEQKALECSLQNREACLMCSAWVVSYFQMTHWQQFQTTLLLWYARLIETSPIVILMFNVFTVRVLNTSRIPVLQ